MLEKSVISTKDLHVGYVNAHILFGIDFEALHQKITLIIGPNGSGKSTLLKSIFGLCTVYSGKITFKLPREKEESGKEKGVDRIQVSKEVDITHLDPYQIARKKIAYLPQTNNVFVNLTIKENLAMASYTLDAQVVPVQMQQVLDLFPVLQKYADTKAGLLSGGQRQMLAMAMALIRRPKVMLFDEPTASLSPKLGQEVLAKIQQIRDEFGLTVILVEQNIKRALKIGDYVYLIAGGKKVFEGKSDELLAHPELGRLYLGTHK